MEASNLSLENLKESHSNATTTAKYLSDSKSSSVQLVFEDANSPIKIKELEESSENVTLKS